MKKREYKSGSRWALWRWTHTPSGYLTRLHLVMTPWFAICLHWINEPDPEPYLHDHPVTFLSIILRGGYTELRYKDWGDGFGPRGAFERSHRWWNFVRASRDDRHTIISVRPRTLTLALMGPKTQEWGFHTRDGWKYWRTYNKEKYKDGGHP